MASTSGVCGSATCTSIDEVHRILPRFPFVAVKVGADRIVMSCHRGQGMPVIADARKQQIQAPAIKSDDGQLTIFEDLQHS
jgi:dTDP-D-glucose 4,6-dehydratase